MWIGNLWNSYHQFLTCSNIGNFEWPFVTLNGKWGQRFGNQNKKLKTLHSWQ